MRTLKVLGLACIIPFSAAQASDLRMTVEPPHFTCQGGHGPLSRASFDPQDVAAPLPCCDGKIACAQFLSTSTIVRQAHEWHG